MVFFSARQFLTNCTLTEHTLPVLHWNAMTNQMFFGLWSILGMFICVAEVYLMQEHCWDFTGKKYLISGDFFLWYLGAADTNNLVTDGLQSVIFYLQRAPIMVGEPDPMADKCRYKTCGPRILATHCTSTKVEWLTVEWKMRYGNRTNFIF